MGELRWSLFSVLVFVFSRLTQGTTEGIRKTEISGTEAEAELSSRIDNIFAVLEGTPQQVAGLRAG